MNIVKKSETGKIITSWKSIYPYPERLIDKAHSLKQNKYPLLQGVAFYEDTLFNSQQTKKLIEELHLIKREFIDKYDSDAIDSLVKFTSDVDLQEYLVFVSD